MRKKLLAALVFAALLTACGQQPADREVSADAEPRAEHVDFEEVFTAWTGTGETLLSGVAPFDDGGWLAAGTGYVPRGYSYGTIAAIDEEGAILWTREWSGGELAINSVIAASDGGFVLAGSDSPTWDDRQTSRWLDLEDEMSEFPPAHRASADYWVSKVDFEGEVIWSSRYSTESDDFCAVAMECGNGDLAFAGTSLSPEGEACFRMVRTGADGSTLWDRTYGLPGGQICDHAVLLSDGSFLIGGTMNSIVTASAAPVFARISADGDELWLNMYGEEGSGHLASFAETSRGGIAAVGWRYVEQGASEAFIIALDGEGEELWWKSYPVSSFDDIAVTGSGEFLVWGDGHLWGIDSAGEVVWTQALDSGPLRVMQLTLIDDDSILLAGSGRPDAAGGDGNRGFVMLLNRQD